MKTTEEFRPIVWLPGYLFSNHGQVIKLYHPTSSDLFTTSNAVTRLKLGSIESREHCYVLKQGTVNGRRTVKLRIDGLSKERRVGDLIAEAWQDGGRPRGMSAEQIDGDPNNNHAANLRWCKRLHGAPWLDAVQKAGVARRIADVEPMDELAALGLTRTQIAANLEISTSLVTRYLGSQYHLQRIDHGKVLKLSQSGHSAKTIALLLNCGVSSVHRILASMKKQGLPVGIEAATRVATECLTEQRQPFSPTLIPLEPVRASLVITAGKRTIVERLTAAFKRLPSLFHRHQTAST